MKIYINDVKNIGVNHITVTSEKRMNEIKRQLHNYAVTSFFHPRRHFQSQVAELLKTIQAKNYSANDIAVDLKKIRGNEPSQRGELYGIYCNIKKLNERKDSDDYAQQCIDLEDWYSSEHLINFLIEIYENLEGHSCQLAISIREFFKKNLGIDEPIIFSIAGSDGDEFEYSCAQYSANLLSRHQEIINQPKDVIEVELTDLSHKP